MNLPRPHSYSKYMEFSKLRSSAKYNLATSGVMNYPLLEIHFHIDDLDINGSNSYGYKPLLEAIGDMKGVGAEYVVEAAGTSMANHLAMAALFAPGDEVLIEEPTYGLLVDTAAYLGAKISRFQRHSEDGYKIDPEEVRRNITARTKLIVITNMHNPTSVLTDTETLRAVGEIANEAGARVLVDEVYLEALFRKPEPSAIHLGKQFVVTSSLTKAYGLSGLRCGWILAEPELAEQMNRLNDVYGATPVYISELLSVFAIEQRAKIADRADALIETNRSALRELLGDCTGIELTVPEVGTTAFPRLREGSVEEFCKLLGEEYETSVVPGVFFERPDHFRVGLAGETQMTHEGLVRLRAALDEWQ